MIDDDLYRLLLPVFKDFFFTLGMLGMLAALAIGVTLVVWPEYIRRLDSRLSAGISTRRSSRALDVPNPIDRYFYRHHRLVGLLVTLASSYVLYYLLFVFELDALSQTFSAKENRVLVEIILDGAWLFMLLVSIATLFIGVLMCLRPSLLKGVEAWSNRWVSTRQAARPLATEHHQVARLVERYPRLVGIVIATLSIYAALGMLMLYSA